MSNASLQQNSLLTGKLTGKIAEIGLMQPKGPSPDAAIMGISREVPYGK
jgi:hypothetical protein